jgi:hypothetical protein
MIVKSVKQVEAQTGQTQVQMGGSNFKKYTLKNSAFVAESNEAYIIDTSNGSFNITLPSNPETGDVVSIADAKGTWNENPATFLNNGKKIESIDFNFINNSQGTFFSLVYVDEVTGWRILESGTKPRNLTAPTITGFSVDSPITSTNGSWSGSPTSYIYKWQISTNGTTGWSDITGATSSSYTPTSQDEDKYVRIVVIAENSNGYSLPKASDASSQILPVLFPTGLLAFWKLNGNGDDSSGNNNHLTNVNNVTFSSGKIGSASNFTAGKYFSSEVRIGGTGNSQNFTFSLWIETTQNSGTNRMISAAGSYNYYFMEYAGKIYANFGGSQFNSTSNVNDGNWHHVVVTYNRIKLRIYIDGVLEVDQNETGVTPLSYVYIGSDDTGNQSLSGSLDSIGIWNRALTSEEVAQIYNDGNGLEP